MEIAMHILWKTYQVWILIIGPDNFIFKDILVFYVFVPTSIRLVITLYKKGLCIVLERLFILNNTDSSISIVLCLLSLSSSCLLSESSLSSPFSSSPLFYISGVCYEHQSSRLPFNVNYTKSLELQNYIFVP